MLILYRISVKPLALSLYRTWSSIRLAPIMYNTRMQDSIFTKIIKGEIPCQKVYEDDKTMAFLDIHPIQPGMVLVVTKVQVDSFLDLEEDDYTALWLSVQKVGLQLRQAFPDKKRVGVIVEGFDVPHVHVKLVPINSGAELRRSPDLSAEPNYAYLEELAKKLAF